MVVFDSESHNEIKYVFCKCVLTKPGMKLLKQNHQRRQVNQPISLWLFFFSFKEYTQPAQWQSEAEKNSKDCYVNIAPIWHSFTNV